MASSTKTGVDLNLTQEARDKLAARAKAKLEAKQIRGERRLLDQNVLPVSEPQCKLKYEDKATCLATGKPYSGNVRCKLCNRGGRF